MRRALWIGLLNSALFIPSLAIAREPSVQDMPPCPPTFWAPYERFQAAPGVTALPGQPSAPIALEAAVPPPPAPGCPTIIDIGQPPIVYSPAGDFGKRVECENAWTQPCGGPTGFQWQTAGGGYAPMPVMIAPPFPLAGAPQPGSWQPHPVAAVAPPPGFSFPQPFPAVAPCCGECAADQQSEHHLQPPCGGYFECPCMPGIAMAAAAGGFPSCPCPNCAMPLPPCAAPMCALPPPPYCTARATNSAGEEVAGRLEHMLEAAQHLEAAGLQTEAHHVRQQSDELVRELIRQTRESKHETTDSASLTSSKKQVAVHVRLMELNLTKMRQLGVEFARSAFIENGQLEVFEHFIKALTSCGIAKTLSAPTVMTQSGLVAHFHCGGECPCAAAQKDGTPGIECRAYGTQLDVQPLVLDGDRIRLHLRPSVTDIDASQAFAAEGQQAPKFHTRELQTTVEMAPGQTMLLSGMVEKRQCCTECCGEGCSCSREANEKHIWRTQDVVLLMIVRPEIVEGENCVITKADCHCPPTATLDFCGSSDQLRCCGDPVSCDVLQCGCALQCSSAADLSPTAASICGEQLPTSDEAATRSIWQQNWFNVGKPVLSFHNSAEDGSQSPFKSSADFDFGGSNSRRTATPVVVPAPDRGTYWK